MDLFLLVEEGVRRMPFLRGALACACAVAADDNDENELEVDAG